MSDSKNNKQIQTANPSKGQADASVLLFVIAGAALTFAAASIAAQPNSNLRLRARFKAAIEPKLVCEQVAPQIKRCKQTSGAAQYINRLYSAPTI